MSVSGGKVHALTYPCPVDRIGALPQANTAAQRSNRSAPKRSRSQYNPSAAGLIEVKSAEGWRYQWHEEVIKRPDLSRSEVAVAGVLMHKYWSERGYAEIGFSTLAARAGCSRSAKAIKRLRQKRLVLLINGGAWRTDRSRETGKYDLIYADRGVKRGWNPDHLVSSSGPP